MFVLALLLLSRSPPRRGCCRIRRTQTVSRHPRSNQSLIGAYVLLTDPHTHDTTYIGANLSAKEK